jgi:predicted enzyme related to lactoylglutathione lyase
MIQPSPSPVVHLELHTRNLVRACSFYSHVCGWHLERVELGGHRYRGEIAFWRSKTTADHR